MPEEKRVDRLFLDASVLVAGAISPPGGSGYILLLGELGSVELLVSQQVLTEARRALTRKAPGALTEFERIPTTPITSLTIYVRGKAQGWPSRRRPCTWHATGSERLTRLGSSNRDNSAPADL